MTTEERRSLWLAIDRWAQTQPGDLDIQIAVAEVETVVEQIADARAAETWCAPDDAYPYEGDGEEE